MSKEDLIHLKGNEDEYSRNIRSRLVGTSSDKRKIAQKINHLKFVSPENIEKKALELATNPKTTSIEIMQMIMKLKERGELKPETEIQLIRALNDAYRTVFGNKVNLQADISQQIAVKTEKAEVQAKKEFFLRTKLLELISQDLEKTFGYEQSIDIMRIIYGATRKVEAEPIQTIATSKAIIITKIQKFLPQVEWDWNKAVLLAKEEKNKKEETGEKVENEG